MATATATATHRERTAGARSAIGSSGFEGLSAVGRPLEYRCECGHALRVFGGGRHRVYFELADSRLDDPIMDRACPQCGRGLPGKNRP